MRILESIENAAKRIAITLHNTSFYNMLASYYYIPNTNNQPTFNHGQAFDASKYLSFYASSNEKRYAIILGRGRHGIEFIFESKQPKKVADWVEKNKDILIAMIENN